MTTANALTAEQKSFYDTNGYLLIKGLLTRDEAAFYRNECHALAHRLQKIKNIDATWGSARNMPSAQQTAVLHCHDVQFHSAAFARLITDPRVMAVATGIIGPNVQLHHTKLLAKPPQKGGAFPLHQDYPYFPHENHTMLAVSIYLDDATMENGCICVVPGSHKLGPLPCDPGGFYLPPAEWPIEKATPVPAKAGDGVVFNYLTVHGSAPNRSPRPRRNSLARSASASRSLAARRRGSRCRTSSRPLAI